MLLNPRIIHTRARGLQASVFSLHHYSNTFTIAAMTFTSATPSTSTTISPPSSSHTESNTIKDTRPLIISGPSGVGKGTLCNLLLSRHPRLFATTVSHTTRAPRPGEIPGREYYFVNNVDFQSLVDRGAFVEHAQFGGNHYGTSKDTIQSILKQGQVPVLDIEMEGVKQIKASHLAARYLFIAPPSMEILEDRLRTRGTEKEESIQKRLAQAHHEMAYAATDGAHDIIIVNDDLEKAYTCLESFVFGNKSAI